MKLKGGSFDLEGSLFGSALTVAASLAEDRPGRARKNGLYSGVTFFLGSVGYFVNTVDEVIVGGSNLI